MGLVNAVWTGPSGFTTVTGEELVPGVTVAEVTEDEARDSEYWSVATKKQVDSEATVIEKLLADADKQQAKADTVVADQAEGITPPAEDVAPAPDTPSEDA